MSKLRSLMLIAAFTVTLLPRVAAAQRLQIHPAIFGGTGISLGVGDANTVMCRSPTSLSAQVLISNSERPSLRYGLSLRGEIERTLSFGVVPQIVFVHAFGRLNAGVLAGIPLIIVPQSLYGVEVGGYLSFSIVERVSLATQALIAFYLLGNDLPKDSLLIMVQIHVGIELHF